MRPLHFRTFNLNGRIVHRMRAVSRGLRIVSLEGIAAINPINLSGYGLIQEDEHE